MYCGCEEARWKDEEDAENLEELMREWEQALRRLLNDKDLRRQMGAKGRDRVERWYSLQVQAPRLEALMRGILR